LRKPLLPWRIALACATAASLVLHPKDFTWDHHMLAETGGKACVEQASFERGRKIAMTRTIRWAKMRENQ